VQQLKAVGLEYTVQSRLLLSLDLIQAFHRGRSGRPALDLPVRCGCGGDRQRLAEGAQEDGGRSREMIYFARLPSGSIKIECTDDVDQRMQSLKFQYGSGLAILHTMPGGQEAEHELHERFAHLRFGRSEQFRAGLDLLEFIGKSLLVNAAPEAVERLEPKKVPIRMDLKPEDHKEMERQAGMRDITISSLARMIIVEWLRDHKGEAGDQTDMSAS
jgi:hypothetical protein